MKREKVNFIKSSVVPLPISNIDTDQIIPARFLKATDRNGFGDNLFKDWRFDSDDNPENDFPLNSSKYKGTVLLAGENFGCGSSREHAAWALYDYGFRVIIAPSFADIFKENALNNGLLPIVLSQELCDTILNETEQDPSTELEVDLGNQAGRVIGSGEQEYFKINAYKKSCLQNGLDDLDYLIQLRPEIKQYESAKEIIAINEI